ncbi:MAG TPA: DUF1993 domain-containing protein [Gemmatimonadaceae bacterium]|nr:DUF1993 domain-containing protein [Gemmatimonadaceae bacterium]
MSLSPEDASVGVFVRGLSNLKTQLMKAEAHAAASSMDAAALLDARLPQGALSDARHDLHTYTLSAQVHWATEGARLAIARIVGAPAVPVASDARNFAELHQRIDATIAHLREITAADLEAGLARTIVVEHRHGTVTADGGRFLLAYAIPHFFYHVTTAYDILRSQGVPLTMGDFLGDWGRA